MTTTGRKRSRVEYVQGRVVIGMTRVRKEVAAEIRERATRDGKSVSCVVNDLLEAALSDGGETTE